MCNVNHCKSLSDGWCPNHFQTILCESARAWSCPWYSPTSVGSWPCPISWNGHRVVAVFLAPTAWTCQDLNVHSICRCVLDSDMTVTSCVGKAILFSKYLRRTSSFIHDEYPTYLLEPLCRLDTSHARFPEQSSTSYKTPGSCGK